MKLRSIKHFIWSIKNRKSIKNWRTRNFSPPSPDIIKHQILINNNMNDSLWIETGTYYGNTTQVLSKISKKTVSIEADKALYELSKKKLNSLKNVEIIFGKSEDLLEKVISENLNFENVCILIDDIRLFKGNFQNYPNKNSLVEWCKENNFLWEIEHDIFICKNK